MRLTNRGEEVAPEKKPLRLIPPLMKVARSSGRILWSWKASKEVPTRPGFVS